MALKFQTGLNSCTDDVDRWVLMEENPDIYGAYLIFQRGADQDHHPLRFAVEARLLSGQPFKEVADLLGINTGTITAYEKLFFNVIEKLKHTDYIMTCVLSPSIHAGLNDRDYDLLWKLFGYLYGPAVLDTFISTTSRRFRPESMNEVDTALADDARSALQRKVAIVARTFIINPFSQSELLNVYARFLEVEKETSSGKAQDVILQNVQVMLDKLPWKSGSDAVAEQTQIAHYDTSASELRADELLSVAAGRAIEREELKFPEIPNG